MTHKMNVHASAEAVEQSQESLGRSRKPLGAQLQSAQVLADQLIEQLNDLPDGDLVAQMLDNALKLLRDRTNRGDLKLINKSFKELRYALKIFAPYRQTRKVSIFGSARTPETSPQYLQAADFAKKMAADGWMVITGAGGGIMAAGHGGAGAKPSFGLAIRLPFEQKTNPFIEHDPKLINFKYFFTRKLMFVRSSDAIALFPGGFGTMDEGFEVLTLVQTGKSVPMPIVMLDQRGGDYWATWQSYVVRQLLGRGLIGEDDLSLFKITDDVDVAIREVRHFYDNYHSLRYVRQDTVMRLNHRPTPRQLGDINDKFSDILSDGAYRVGDALPAERDEPAIKDLPRLIFNFNRHDHGRLRQLINYVNDLPDGLAVKAHRTK